MQSSPDQVWNDDDQSRMLLAFLAAGLFAGGAPAHEVEDDVRAVTARLGHRDAQVDAAPTSVRLTLGHGGPATIETVECGLRPQLSRVVVFLPSSWLLVPGSLSLLSITQLETRPLAALDAILFATGVMVAIALGVVVGASLARSLRRAARRSGMRQQLRQVARRRAGAVRRNT